MKLRIVTGERMNDENSPTPDLDWRELALGARVRIALWLNDQIPEGSRFTLSDLSDALSVPNKSSLGRRLRELERAGWVIHNSRDRPDLRTQEWLLVQIGAPVWQPRHRAAGLSFITSAQRGEVLARDGYRCARCGVAAREPYPDALETTARLVVIETTGSGGDRGLTTVCARCNSAEAATDATSAEQVWEQMEALSHQEKMTVLAWMIKGRRDWTPAERVFAHTWELSADKRHELMSRLADLLAT